MEISQEKAKEYQQIAALSCLALDEILLISNTYENIEEFIKYIKMKKEDINNMISDPEKREQVYNTHCLIFSLNK